MMNVCLHSCSTGEWAQSHGKVLMSVEEYHSWGEGWINGCISQRAFVMDLCSCGGWNVLVGCSMLDTHLINVFVTAAWSKSALCERKRAENWIKESLLNHSGEMISIKHIFTDRCLVWFFCGCFTLQTYLLSNSLYGQFIYLLPGEWCEKTLGLNCQ